MNDKKWNETFLLPAGFRIDLDEAWRKIISRQFAGKPGRAFGELIQNLLDSYPSKVPWEKRRGEIEASGNEISITDYGEGMDLARLNLIATLGGTDKEGNAEKIGRFGIGFFSIFNPRLGTRRVQVTTNCEGKTVELTFSVKEAGKKPDISARILQKKAKFSTSIKATFQTFDSVQECLDHAKKVIQYYPCSFSINGKASLSVWDEAKRTGEYTFREDACHGIIMRGSRFQPADVLCKYDHVIKFYLRSLVTGGHDMTWDLRDYLSSETPVLRDLSVVLNCNDLLLTISRDSFFLNSNHKKMVRVLSKHLAYFLSRDINWEKDHELILANQYILRKRIRGRMAGQLNNPRSDETREEMVLRKLIEAKVYPVSGSKDLYSLKDLYCSKRSDLPFFFSPDQINVDWLGGCFKHDIVVLPRKVTIENGAPDLYDELFGELYDDVVNLDKISGDRDKILDLIERGIIDKSVFTRNCKVIGRRNLIPSEREFLKEIGTVLNDPEVKDVIQAKILVPIKSIRTSFFEQDGEARVSTGVFEEEGKPWEGPFSNDEFEGGRKTPAYPNEPVALVLGIRRDHPIVVYLLNSDDPHRVYYAVMFLAHELVLCQKLLVPFSPFFHKIKESLAADIRTVLLSRLLNDKETNSYLGLRSVG